MIDKMQIRQVMLARAETRITPGNVMYCNMKGITLRNGALCKFHLPGVCT